MKLSLKKVGDRFKLLVQKLAFTSKFVSDCCCTDRGRYGLWQECCDGNPQIYVPFALLDSISCTSGTIKYGPNCYNYVTFSSVTRQEAIDSGLTVVEDSSLIECIADGAGGAPCQSPPCRLCPQDCCMISIIPKGCSMVVSPNPTDNLCCNYGRVATRQITKIERDTFTYNTSVNASAGDTYCPPGCSFGLFAFRSDRNLAYSDTATFQQCDSTGQRDERMTSCDAMFVSTNMQQTRRYGFEGGLPIACLQYTDTFTGPDEVRNSDCQYQGGIRNFDFPGPMLVDGQMVCEIFNRIESPDCDNSTPPGCWTYTTDMRRDAGCFSGSFELTVTGVKRASPDSECPPPGTVVATSRVYRLYTYSIRKDSSSFCEGNRFCDDYFAGRNRTPSPNPDSDGGALILL